MRWELAVLVLTACVVSYTWLGYPILLACFRWDFKRTRHRQPTLSTISVIIASYNEEARIAAKLNDTLALDYPNDRLEIIVASDGSTDATEAIVHEFATRDARIRLVCSQGRAGKSGVQNLAVEHARGDILLFTDAETTTRPELLRLLAEDFADENVGLVAPTVLFGKADSAVSKGQGAYWRFELFLRQLESDAGILATASGSAFAMRRSLFRPIPSQYGDDCIVPLDVRLQGYRVVQDRRLMVYDEMPHSIDGELRARVRMTARNWTGILSRPQLLNPLRYPGTAWGLISHKFLRWMTPLFLAAIFVTNCILTFQHRLQALFILQLCFYLAAFVGWHRSRRRLCNPFFGYPFAICLANVGFFLGLLRCLRRDRIIAYK